MEKAVTAVSLRQTYSAQVWKSRVASCRSSGQSVKAWCAENAICVQTYYRWERKLLAEAENSRKMSRTGRFAELPIAGAAKDNEAERNAIVAVLRAEGEECEIRSSITEELLRAPVGSMSDHA